MLKAFGCQTLIFCLHVRSVEMQMVLKENLRMFNFPGALRLVYI